MLYITESWLSEYVTNGMLDCSHSHIIYRKDRPHKQRGGGLIGLIRVIGGNKHAITFLAF